jgi:hypothetical protein
VTKQSHPRNALERVQFGQSFAQYDNLLKNPNVFVRTPALNAALDEENAQCFFVGRRGTGKTTITRFVESSVSDVIMVYPEIFSPSSSLLGLDAFRDAKQRPFKSLTSAFRRTLQDEALFAARGSGGRTLNLTAALANEIETYSDYDFDLRALAFIDSLVGPLLSADDASWIRSIRVAKDLCSDISTTLSSTGESYTILIDAIDESWDGSQLAVVYLAAMMHACLEVNSYATGVRVLMFIRENIFERVRLIDTEFSRLETCVVGLDWSDEQLLEVVERRLNANLTAKFRLGGETWDHFFEDGPKARDMVFGYSQRRPRDVLTYCALALETAQTHRHQQILLSDLQDARRRFSDSRLNDLGDEYQENYPQISMLLAKFYGLGRRWALSGITEFLVRVIEDVRITQACAKWLYNYTSPELFVRLLYEIGFFGLLIPKRGGDVTRVFRSLGPRDTTPPPIDHRTDIEIHPAYWEALDLQDVLITEFDENSDFGTLGLVTDLPRALDFESYQEKLSALNDELKDFPEGSEHASRYEDLVGEVLQLCFFRTLYNFEAQSRDVSGSVRRDWIASNRAESGFWEMIRHSYAASQVIFECKNYSELNASDFHQAKYYMTSQAGKAVFIVFRGEIKRHYYDHIRRVTDGGGIVLLLNHKDLRAFARQAMNGRVKESLLQDRFDATIRSVS